ncbi:MAG TPA: type I glyceraldehyde-3-phosphate dehydrogenase [Acidimicrobiales bacterium]
MTLRIGINGLGRIGRAVVRAVHERNDDIEVVAANDIAPVEQMAHLLRFDSVYGRFPGDVRVEDGGIAVGDHVIRYLTEREPKSLPWGDLGVEVVIESTGRFRDRAAAAAHIDAGASFVVVSAPCKGADATFVVGVNDDTFDPEAHQVVSNASCTTNCFVPMVKVLDDAFGVERGLMTTVHAYTGDQMLVDGSHKDLRRARSAAINIVPTSTGAARATGLVLAATQGRLDGQALRVPVVDGSLTDFTAVLTREVTPDEVNEAFRASAAEGRLSRVLDYSEEPLVSSDIVGSPASCTFDAGLTQAIGNLVKVFGWYDNEWGYAQRLVDLVLVMG